MNKKSFFGQNLENINYTEILSFINKLKNNFPCFSLESEEEIMINDSLLANKNPTLNSLKIQSKIRYPIYKNGSFREDIDNFLNQSCNKSIKQLFNKIEKEINKIYKGYIAIENVLYEKITGLINFCENREEFSKLQIISRIKEISEILEESYNFITNYLFYNFSVLKFILQNLDNKLSKLYNVKSLSLFFILKYFDIPNNELSYILIFKIFDEETLILNYILNNLETQIKLKKNSLEYNIINTIESNKKLDNRESRILSDESDEELNETINIMLDLMDNYINKSKNISKKINNIDEFRVLYNNYFIYLKENNNLVNNDRFLYNSITSSDEGSNINNSKLSDLLSINSLMDEEVIIKNFLDKELFKPFLNSFKKNLPLKYKIKKFLIYIHCIQNNSITSIILFWYYSDITVLVICSYMISYCIGKFFAKIINSSLLIKKISIKSIIILSNIILIISLSLNFINLNEIKYQNILLLINRFLIGLSYSNNIESKFLIRYEPKLLIIESSKKVFGFKYISICLAIIYTSLINIFSMHINLNFLKKIHFLNFD